MTAAQFRKLVFRTPFRAVEVKLDSGEVFLVRHPEAVAVVEDLCIASTPEGLALFDLPHVASIRYRRNGKARRRA